MNLHCRDCPYWSSDGHDRGMGTCTGLVASGRIEFNIGAYAADEVEILTPADHFCEIVYRIQTK